MPTENYKNLLSVTKAAKILGVSADTLRNWERSGKLIPQRTAGGARRYDLTQLQILKTHLNPFPKKPQGFLTVSKAAKLLNVSKDTLRNWDKKGVIESARTKGGARRFSKAEIRRVAKELGLQLPEKPVVLTPISTYKIPWLSLGLVAGLLTFGLVLALVFGLKQPSTPSGNDSVLGESIKDLEGNIFNLASSIEKLQGKLFEIESSASARKVEQFAPQNLGNLSSNIIPASDDTINLGSALRRFDLAYISQIKSERIELDTLITDTLNPTTANVFDIGSKDAAWHSLYLSESIFLGEVKISSGKGQPDSSFGENGDLYFRVDAQDPNQAILVKVNNNWSVLEDHSSLQQAYESGETISTTDGRDLVINLEDNINDADLKITLKGDNSFVINDEVNDLTPITITGLGDLGLGTATPSAKLEIYADTINPLEDVVKIYSDVGGERTVIARLTASGDLFLQGSVFENSQGILSNLSIDSDGALVVPVLKVEKLILEDVPLSASEDSGSLTFASMAQIDQRIAAVENKVEDLTSSVQQLDSKYQSQESLIASQSAQLASLNATVEELLTPPEILIATDSALLSPELTAASEPIASLTVFDSFSSLGQTRLGSTLIAGDLTVNGMLTVNENSLNSLDVLYLQNSPLAGAVDLFDGKVIIDKTGQIKAESILVAEFKVLANKISGQGVIKKGENSAVIENTLVKNNSRILVTPSTNIEGSLAVTEKLEGLKFTVSSTSVAPDDILFDWFMFQEISGQF